MQEKMYLRARWSSRKEAMDACAIKMSQFLKDLTKCDEIFAKGWLKCGQTRQSIPKHVDLSLESLRDLLENGRPRQDRNRAVIENLGSMPGRLWNGSEAEPAHIWIQCGAYPDPKILPSANAVWIDLPTEGGAAERIIQPDKLGQIMAVVADSWDPDWARVSTNKTDAEIYQENPYLGQMVGWLTYVSDRYGQLPALPKNCRVNRVGNRGNLVVIDVEGRLTASNSVHLASLEVLSHVFNQAGLLNPTPPLDRIQR